MVHPAKAICHFYLNENLKNPVKGEKNKKDVERGGWVWYISCHLTMFVTYMSYTYARKSFAQNTASYSIKVTCVRNSPSSRSSQ